jgi:CTP synthase (UTP-ammonia lyase)
MSCSLAGTSQPVKILPDTFVHKIYQVEKVEEKFTCNYGLDQNYRNNVQNSALIFSGIDKSGEVSIFELSDHPFFIATLFQPQLSSKPGMPHPLIAAFLKTALESKTSDMTR